MRKSLDLTQQEFADRLNIKRNTVATYETGKSNPSDAAVVLICKTFNVSETWLRTGDGDMFVPSPNGVLDELAQKYGLSSRGKIIVERFLDLKPDVQEAVADYIEQVAAAFGNANPTAPAPAPAGQEETPPDIAVELSELKRQNQELAAKVAAIEEEERDEELTADFGAALSALQSGLAGGSEKVKK